MVFLSLFTFSVIGAIVCHVTEYLRIFCCVLSSCGMFNELSNAGKEEVKNNVVFKVSDNLGSLFPELFTTAFDC